MGYELRRYLAEFAPPAWRPVMRLVAFEIADRAPDPGQLKDGDRLADGAIKSRILLEGHKNRQGEYVKGLTDFLGMAPRQVTDALKALAKAKYEMRVQVLGADGEPLFDKNGLPVFAREGHLMRLRVPILAPVLLVANLAAPPDPWVPKKVPTDPSADLFGYPLGA